ncbi:MAG TPA: HD domain-containing protein [Candidatus Saccharimonadales bacterium]|nr:HD domain-containing protein [Candidatus Saccharimonadales bacterium]
MKLSRPEPLLFALQDLVVDMALIERNHHLAGHERAESDVDHSFAVAMLCWYICDKYALPLDQAKVLKYALIHDFTEKYVGDINTYADKAARDKKVEQEKEALKRLEQDFHGFDDLTRSLRGYDAQTDEEALFVWTVDKMQAIILGEMDDWRPYKKVGVTYEQFVAKHSGQLAKSSPYCKEIFSAILEYSKSLLQ